MIAISNEEIIVVTKEVLPMVIPMPKVATQEKTTTFFLGDQFDICTSIYS
jgi:hypothetical protein